MDGAHAWRCPSCFRRRRHHHSFERHTMATFQSQLGSGYASQDNPGLKQGTPNSMVSAAQQGSAQAMEFQLWVSQQATSLAKLKIFSTMAKSVNDQQ
jgi:hypothetical protein